MNTRKNTTTFQIALSAAFLIGAAVQAYGGDYYTYKDAKGNLVISNSAPPAGRAILKTEALPEVTDQEIAEARAREQAAGLDNRLANLERAVDDLSGTVRSQNETAENYQPGYGDGGVIVGVTNGFVRRPPAHRPIKRPPGSKNDSPGRGPRAQDAAPSQQPRAKAG
jgi:hypothetical protein